MKEEPRQFAAGKSVDGGKATDLERLEVLKDVEVQGRHESPARPVVILTPHQVGENPAKTQLSSRRVSVCIDACSMITRNYAHRSRRNVNECPMTVLYGIPALTSIVPVTLHFGKVRFDYNTPLFTIQNIIER